MVKILARAVDIAVREREQRARTDRFFNDPVGWAEYMLGATLWSKQREISMSLNTERNVAVKAGHGVGKSFLVSMLICWWIDTRYPNVFVASTAPSQAQIGAIVWREIRTHKRKIDEKFKKGEIDHALPGYITSDNVWKMDDGTILGFGRRPPEEKEESAVQGIHAEYVLAVGDEACGLSEEMIDALSNITSNKNSRRILIGNPTNPASRFGKIFKQDTGAWALNTISVLDSPHFTDEWKSLPDSVLESLTNQEYVEEKKKEYGEDSARYKARVLGEFAFDLGDTLIQEADLAPARDRIIIPDDDSLPVLGVDIARMGDDSSVVYLNHDGHVRLLASWDKADALESAKRVHDLAVGYSVKEVRIDAAGVGGGVKDLVAMLSEGKYHVIEMYGQAASPNKIQWYNARAFWYDNARSLLRQGKLDIDIDDETLGDELMSVEYKFFPNGGLLIESKLDMKKRGMKSPDYADAFIYATADLNFLGNDPFAKYRPGDEVNLDIEEYADAWSSVLDW